MAAEFGGTGTERADKGLDSCGKTARVAFALALLVSVLLASKGLLFPQMGRVLHAVGPTCAEHMAHVFGVYGFQAADKDPEKLALTEHLF